MNHSFNTDLAKQLGVHAAVIMEHIAFWIIKNQSNNINFRNGKYWTYSTVNGFREYFDYLSYKQIRTALERLEENGFLETGTFNTLSMDRTKWYSFGPNAMTYYGEKIKNDVPRKSIKELQQLIDSFKLPKKANGDESDLPARSNGTENTDVAKKANGEPPSTANQMEDIHGLPENAIQKTELPHNDIGLPSGADGLPSKAEHYHIENADKSIIDGKSFISPLTPKAEPVLTEGACTLSASDQEHKVHVSDGLSIRQFNPVEYIVGLGVDPQVAQDYVTHRKCQKAPVTKTVVDRVVSKARQYGQTLQEALIDVCEKGWRGYFPTERKNRHKLQSDNGFHCDAFDVAAKRVAMRIGASYEA